MVISSGAGYAAAPEKKSRWKLVLIVVGVVVLLGAAAAAVFLAPSLLKSGPKNASEAFNLYSNYLLYGKESAGGLEGEYARTTMYEMDAVLERADDEKVKFYAKLGELFGVFREKYDAEVDDGNLDELVDNHEELLGFAEKFAEATELTDAVVMDFYLREGEMATRDYVGDYYRGFAESGSDVDAQYYALKSEQFERLIDAFNAYRDAGCMEGGVVDEACASALAESNAVVQENYGKFYEVKYDAEQMVLANRDNLLGGCWTIGGRVAEVVEAK